MFTGLVEGLGTVVAIVPNGPGVDLTLEPAASLPEASLARLGDSVAINGCCLTVIEIRDHRWVFQAGSETLSRTNLGKLVPGDSVNLERSVRPTDRLGGHFVQGHVDDLGHVDQILNDGDWTTMWFHVPPRLTRQMVSKGSITVDGVSLTLVDVTDDRFSIALIPHTLQVTTLGQRRVGDFVNIETDIIGKYVEKLTLSREKGRGDRE
ncbi:riboflavin synthase [Planctomicrobium piriforme]|uniref:Riboflavin synthase n=1 Tax=Planctomicrobium piriforme TaxID=1576369 RepID=A0A1I3QYF6_9PLAN|nr:riboflavin synthase [Planctomicrobium piriforme]SFJ39098.1 riboflavin synthase [Planctomicrobium piriforme]